MPAWKFLVAVTLAALAIRLVAMCFLYTESYNDFDNHLLFGFEIGRIARSLALGHGFANPMLTDTGPTAWATPIYPYLLAGVFRIFGVFTESSAFAILSMNSIFSALTCIPIYLAAVRSFDARTARVAACLWAIWPYSVYIASSFVWETCLSALLFACIFAAALKLRMLCKSGDGPGYGTWLAFGLLWGFATLTNSSVLAVFPFVVAWAMWPLWQQRPRMARGQSVISAALVLVGLMVMIFPWQVRNYRTFHQQVPMRDTFWVAFWVGNDGHPESWADAAVHPTISAPEQAEFVRLGEIPYTMAKRQQSLDFLGGHRALFAVTTVRRFVYFWTGFWNLNPMNLAVEFRGASNVFLTSLLSLLMLLGFWKALRTAPAGVLPYAIVLAFYPLVFYITVPEIRYRHMIEPEMTILAAVGLRFLLSELVKGFPWLGRLASGSK
jgi:4-amino-4-deoxy-L-arabinose transferase-like glycosyltransferase